MNVDLERSIRAAANRSIELRASGVWVFGSAVRGTIRPDSDIDLAAVGLPATAFFRAITETSRIVGRPVDLLELDRGDENAASLASSGELLRVA